MRKRNLTIWVIVAVLCLVLSKADAVRIEGGTWLVDWEINDVVEIMNNPYDLPTTVNLLAGGSITGDARVHYDSRLNVVGGLIGGDVVADGSGEVTIFDGILQRDLIAAGSSQVTVLGGEVMDWLTVAGYSYALISGGSIGTGIRAESTGKIIVVGTDFKINGQSVDYGCLTNSDYPSGILTGTLANGDPLDTHFDLYHSGSIFLTPEPSTLLLLGLGAVMLRKRRSS